MRSVLVAVTALVLAGCGTDTRYLEGADAADPVDNTTGTGGTGGQSHSGSGGAMASVVQPITQADVLSCELWPICPEGIIAPRSSLSKISERCGLGGYACTVCRDMRGGQCKDFVGRCRAPNTSVGNGAPILGTEPSPSDCDVSESQPDEKSFIRCTGVDLIDVLCGDAPWPT